MRNERYKVKTKKAMVYLANELGFEKDANAIAVYADQEKENLNDLAMDEFVLEQDGLGFFK